MAHSEQDDIAFLNDPDRWPQWPLCPVKRYLEPERRFEFAVVYILDKEWKLIEGAMIWGDPAEWELLPRLTYSNASAIVAEGWRVD